MKIRIDNHVIPADAIISIFYEEGYAFFIHLIGSERSIEIKRSNDYVSVPKDMPPWPSQVNYPSINAHEKACKDYRENPIVKKYDLDVKELRIKNKTEIQLLYDTLMKHWKPKSRFLDINKLSEGQARFD